MKQRFSYAIIIIAGVLSVFAFSSFRAEKKRLRSAKTTRVAPTPQRVRLLFAGDAMCHTPQISSARCKDGSLDFRPAFAGVKPHFDKADIAVVNLETTISPNLRYSGYPCFSSPKQYADALDWLGADVAVLANNHCCDNGAIGIRTTIAKLDSLGIAHTGVFHNAQERERNAILRLEHNGIKLAILNYTYGTNGIPVPKGCFVNFINTTQIAKDVELASKGSDCVIACMHWGYEYQQQPSSEQRRLAQFLHSHGVDLVIGSHPHVVQPYVATDSLITVYSLGNFISNQKKPNTDGGLLAEIEIEKGADGVCKYSLHVIPVWVKYPGHRLVSSEHDTDVKMTNDQRARYQYFLNNTKRLLEKGMNF